MPGTVIAIDQRHAGALMRDVDIGFEVEATGTNPLGVRRQTNHPVTVGALQISLSHQAPNGCGIGLRHTERFKRCTDEPGETID